MTKVRIPLVKPSKPELERMKKDPNYMVPTVEFDYDKALRSRGAFDLMRQDIYAADQMEALKIQRKIRKKRFRDKLIDGMKDKDVMVLYKELRMDQKDKFEQERLEKGESTRNVAVIVAAINALKEKEMIDE